MDRPENYPSFYDVKLSLYAADLKCGLVESGIFVNSYEKSPADQILNGENLVQVYIGYVSLEDVVREADRRSESYLDQPNLKPKTERD